MVETSVSPRPMPLLWGVFSPENPDHGSHRTPVKGRQIDEGQCCPCMQDVQQQEDEQLQEDQLQEELLHEEEQQLHEEVLQEEDLQLDDQLHEEQLQDEVLPEEEQHGEGTKVLHFSFIFTFFSSISV